MKLAQEYPSEPAIDQNIVDDATLSLSITQNLVVIPTVTFIGKSPDLGNNLADMKGLECSLKALINQNY